MKKLSKRLFSSLLGLVMLFALLPTTAFAANWNPADEITITVRVYDQSTGVYYVVGTDTCTKGDQYVRSDAYKIPQLTAFVDSSTFGRVTKVVGNWYYPTGDSSQGATVYWSCNASTATMTYWVDSYNPAGSSSGGTTQDEGTVPSGSIWIFYLRYDLNGGTNSSSFPTQSYGTTDKYVKSHTFSTHTVTPVREGYVFKYWQQTGSITTTRELGEETKVTATGISGYTGGTVTDTLTAVWEKVESTPATSVTVTYIDRDDTYATMTAFAGDTMTAVNNTASNDGYTFGGWATSSDATTVVYEAGDSFVVNGNTTLYAVWTKNSDPETTYTVTYTDGVAGEEVFEDQVYTNVTAGDATPAFSGTPTREGYTFAGWSPTLAETVTEDVTYTAQWTKESTDPVDPDPDDPEEKISEPGIEKEVVGNDDNNSVEPGDTVRYELTSTVPENLQKSITYAVGTAGDYVLTFHDTMDSALALNVNSIKVTVGGNAIESQYYSVNTNPEDGCTFEVAVNLASLYNDDVITEDDLGVAEIVVSYTATLDDDAEPGAYQNNAWVTFPEGKSEEDTEEVYTYGVKIFKYDTSDVDENGNLPETGLAGAQFQLKDAEGNVVATLTTDEEGYASVDGLKEGTYYLTEIKAPDGYVSNKEPITVTVTKVEAGSDYIVEIEFGNTPIPSTGGTGTYLYTFGGIGILCLAGVVFVISRKKRTAE